MKRSFLLPALALLVLAAIVGCAPPYFAELDAAGPLLRHMSAVGTVGPVSAAGGSSLSTVRFLPTKPTAAAIGGLSITSGFVIASDPSYDYLSFAYLDANGVAQLAQQPPYAFQLTGADPNYPFYEYDVTATATQPSIIVFHYDPASPTGGTYEQLLGDPLTGQFTRPSYALTAAGLKDSIFFGYTPVGGSIVPAQPAPQDTVAFLVYSAGTYGTAALQINGVSSIFPAGGAVGGIGAPLSPPTLRSLYYLSPTTGASIVSYYSGGQWVCFESRGALSTLMTGVTHRLDAVLSTGDFLSTEGGTLRLYDPGGTGTEVLSVPLNGLQFCYEAWVGSTPYVFFTLPLSARHDRWAFSVFAISTSQMRTLGS